MKRLVMVFSAVIALLPAALFAQEVPTAEVFGGFSTSSLGGSNQHYGWVGAVAYNVTSEFGLVGDFGGLYNTEEGTGFKDVNRAHTFLFGPRYSARADKATGFVHFLLGAAKNTNKFTSGSTTTTTKDTNFALAIGGGMDINAGEKIKVRVLQIDWIPVKINPPSPATSFWSKDNIRLGFGVVFGFGGL
jgi:opacity protein-like surface antigen